ncbi:MAG: nucleotidyltransferase family protein [Verrucomicrobiales bacterium]
MHFARRDLTACIKPPLHVQVCVLVIKEPMDMENKDTEGTSSEITYINGEPAWAKIIPEDQWDVYLTAIHATHKTGTRFMLGGAFGLAGYTGRWRNTKDLDFFVLPSEKDKVIQALTEQGFVDYYDQLAYDRGWIYRAVKNDVLVDTIWSTPNRRAEVDEQWFQRSQPIKLHGESLQLIPAEELLCIKAYVMQRDRCDWPDLINLLYVSAGKLDWNHVLARMADDMPLHSGLLQVFNWIAPEQAAAIPAVIRGKFNLPDLSSQGNNMEKRVGLLDSRPWFAAFQPQDKPMQL